MVATIVMYTAVSNGWSNGLGPKTCYAQQLSCSENVVGFYLPL
jgi:hypothetical protein